MIRHKVVLGIFLLIPLVSLQEVSNSTHFVATSEWQEINEGQRVPQGLHYRINLETGYKEAKILHEENEKTSLVATDETKKHEKSDVDVDSEIGAARKRLEEALKNIPAEKYDKETEESWKEISHKFRSYKEIKEDLKDLELSMKTEMEIMNSLVKELDNESLKDDENAKYEILDHFEYLCHNIDNSLHFISVGGLDNILIPNLNDSSKRIVTKSIRLLAVILQNNYEAKNHVIEKTNIANYLINVLSKSNEADQLATAIFAFGSLLRNNQKAIRGLNDQAHPSETFKKGVSVITEIISNQKTTLKVSLKALTLIGDLLSDISSEDHESVSKYVTRLKVCEQLEKFFAINRNTIISDIDTASLVISSLDDLKIMCGSRGNAWSDSANFRHEIIVTLNSFKSQLNEIDEDSKFMYEETIEKLESLSKFLYDHLEISNDDLSAKYKINDEL